MKLSDFKFDLPKDLIANFPPENRDESKLMVINRNTADIQHQQFKDLLAYFDDGDLMILKHQSFSSSCMVIKKTGAIISVLLRE